MTTLPNSDENQVGKSLPEYIVVRLGYSNQLILPVDDGLALVRALGRAWKLVEEYKKPPKITDWDDDIRIKYMPRQEFNEIRMAQILEEEEPDNDG